MKDSAYLVEPYRILSAILVSILFLPIALLYAATASAQSVETYAYVHKKLIELTAPPWQCVCYSASRESVIMTHNSANQVWVVERYNSMAAAMAARDTLNAGPNVCSFCPGGSGTRQQIFIFQNCNSGRCEIGVADGTYSQPGWFIKSTPFKSHPEAWVEACRIHNSGAAYAPAIAQGTIKCDSLAAPSDGQCINLTRNHKYGPHNGRTRCCNEKKGSRWWGPHYGVHYTESGKFSRHSCNSWLGITDSDPKEDTTPSFGQCYSLTQNDKYGPHNGRTRCCNEKGSSRWWGKHYGSKYSTTGKLYQRSCESWLGR
ncbi:MAG: hypothetical protein OQK12_19040 [Motiliproteus sp.]|nr:hypothetical protein [Motiliproteus sp.]MCW9052659.1 hypothetical protein [Motiliproteus sp.]